MIMDYELTLFDRLEVIKNANLKYDLENNAYISFSGGKDSTILHYLVDIALPNNRIPRVFIDTGIEFLLIRQFVLDLAEKDDRFVIIKPTKPIKPTLEEYGYPFKSKEFSARVYDYKSTADNIDKYMSMSKEEYTAYMLQHKEEEKALVGKGIFILNYLKGVRAKRDENGYVYKYEQATKFTCPKALKHLFDRNSPLNINDSCCLKLKKEPVHKWQKENKRSIAMTGMRREEGGQRENIKGCILTDKNGKVTKFHPLLVVDDKWENEFIKQHNIKLCALYYEPYNFDRTGCKGCPFSLNLQEQLDILEIYLPNERKHCEIIWKPVYDEYRRLGYRLRKDTGQLNLFDFKY